MKSELSETVGARSIYALLALAAFWTMSAVGYQASASDIRTERVRFTPGTDGTTIEASIRGDEIVDYLVGAKAGQGMSVSMSTDNDASYFNILAPGETEAAMFIGSTSGGQYEGTLPATGDYKIRVYLMRSAARRNEVANFRLEMTIGSGSAAGQESSSGSDDDPYTRIGTDDFDATGQVPCSRGSGQPMATCAMGVVRMGAGSALVKINWPDGGSRIITFEDGEPTAYDESEADAGATLTFEKDSDLYLIRIGKQRFEIVEAIIYGG